MKKELFNQVLLQKILDEKVELVTFIQSKFKKGSKVIDEDKIMWRVKEIYSNSVIDEECASIRSRDYRNHRKATDI